MKDIAAIEGVTKRKERQLWKLDENIKELKTSSEEATDSLVKLNRRIGVLCKGVEEHLGKNIKRRVMVTRGSF